MNLSTSSVPAPRECAFTDGLLTVTSDDRIALFCDPELAPAARWWADVTQHAFGIDVTLHVSKTVPVTTPGAVAVVMRRPITAL